jgi:hypothetical protein
MASGWNQALITANEERTELEPVQAILELVQEAKLRAIRILASIETEYQSLRSTVLRQDPKRERRFFWLRWQRHALQQFIAQQTPVIEDLWTETNNVWSETELEEIELQEADQSPDTDDKILAHAPAA